MRDHESFVIAARSHTRSDSPEPSSAKAVGAYFAVCFCQELGMQNLILDGDAQVVVKAVCSTEINIYVSLWSYCGKHSADS